MNLCNSKTLITIFFACFQRFANSFHNPITQGAAKLITFKRIRSRQDKKNPPGGGFIKMNELSGKKLTQIQAACFSFFLFTCVTSESKALSKDSSNDFELHFTKNWCRGT